MISRRHFLRNSFLTSFTGIVYVATYNPNVLFAREDSLHFDNNSSEVMFIGKRKLEEVIAKDTEELKKLKGSFKEIADKMDALVKFAEKQKSLPKDYDKRVRILSYIQTKGFQLCPFNKKDCPTWSEIVKIESKKTGYKLTINSGTAHLARAHNLLEKDNEYGISASEFYRSFI